MTLDKESGLIREVVGVWESKPTLEGAGVHLRRAFGFQEVPRLDPFLLLDAFKSENPEDYRAGFPWHPHRGIETITYVLDGEVEHGNSLGNGGLISSGDVQWMTAGGGIVHQEMPKGDRRGQMWGFQLWANLPARDKMMDPRYQEIKRPDIPLVKTGDGATVRIICGELNGVQGPVRDIVSDPEFLDVSLPPGNSFTHRVKPGHTVFAYVMEGKGQFGESSEQKASDRDAMIHCESDTLVLYGLGDTIQISAEAQSTRFLLVSGKPFGEPVAWYGPLIMNTQDELRTAFDEYSRGTFLKHSLR